MTIHFTCSNPSCRRPLIAMDRDGGTRTVCPACQTPQVVPGRAVRPPPAPRADDDPQEIVLVTEWVEEAPPPYETVTCRECREEYNAGLPSCPVCGWRKPFITLPLGESEPESSIVIAEDFRTQWYQTTGYGALCFRRLLKPAALLAVLQFVLSVTNLVLRGSHAARYVVWTCAAVVGFAAFAYFLQFLLEIVRETMDALDAPPEARPPKLAALLVGGLRGLGVLAVYVLPVVTLPLLPLGWLALACTQDARAYNVLWAARAAGRRPRSVLLLWVAMLLYCAAASVFILSIGLLGGVCAVFEGVGGGFGFALAFPVMMLSAALNVTVVVVFTCTIFRWIGIFARVNSDLLDLLGR